MGDYSAILLWETILLLYLKKIKRNYLKIKQNHVYGGEPDIEKCVRFNKSKSSRFCKRTAVFRSFVFFERKFAKKSFFIVKNMVQYSRITNARKTLARENLFFEIFRGSR